MCAWVCLLAPIPHSIRRPQNPILHPQVLSEAVPRQYCVRVVPFQNGEGENHGACVSVALGVSIMHSDRSFPSPI